MSSTVKKIDHLTEDPPIQNQLFVCMSFLSPEGIRNCKVRGLKIRGVYGTKEEADARAKELQKTDSDFHVFVGEVGKWLPWDPDPNSVGDQIYKEDELQKLMESYKKNREHVKELEHERKEELIKNVKADNKKQEIINRLRKKLDQKQESKLDDKQEDNIKIKELEQEIKETEKIVVDTKDIIDNLQQTDTAQQDTENLDDKLSKIMQIYKEINK